MHSKPSDTNRFKFISIVLLLFLFQPFNSGLAATAAKGIQVRIKNNSGREINLYGGSYALIIGIGRYTAGWPNLDSVPGELEAVRTALKAHQFEISKVENPDSDTLREAFENFIDAHGFEPGNRLLFFFSGHGHSRQNGTKGYIVPADAPDPRRDKVGFLRKAISMSQIMEWSRRIEAKHALFVFDSCFSGTVFKTRALPKSPPHINSFIARPVRQFISAGSAGEEVPAKSVFTPVFIRALRGEGDLNQDHFVTGTELGMYLHQKVLFYGTGQTPQYGKIRDPELDEGDIVFALPHISESDFSDQKITVLSVPKNLQSPKIPPQSLQKMSETPLEKSEQESSDPSKPLREPPFIVRKNGVVYDPRTQLEWVVGPDRDTSFLEARSWVEKLTLDGGGWRLPTRKELRSLYQKKSRFSCILPQWVALTGSGIWSNYTRPPLYGVIDYYYLSNGVEYKSSSARDGIDKRALSVRRKTPVE